MKASYRREVWQEAVRVLTRYRAGSEGSSLSFPDFLARQIVLEKVGYGFDEHGPLEEIARRLPELREVWILKGAQVGLSTLAVAWCVYLAWIRGKNVGYALPSKIFARRFLKTRFGRVVEASPVFKNVIRTTENVGLMAVEGGAHIYMLGMENVTDAISIPLDALVCDEVDVLNRENLDWADDRLAASDYGQRPDCGG